jgi:hypothetical protein
MDDVVFATIRMKEHFRVAHELLLCYMREIDFDPTRNLHMGNVFRRGGQDTLLSEARRNAAVFFRTSGGTPQLDGAKIPGDRITKNPKPDLKPNGKAAGADMHVAASAGSLTRSGLSVGRDLLSRVRLLLLGGRVRLESCSRSILVTGHVSADERPTLGEDVCWYSRRVALFAGIVLKELFW